MHIQEFINWYQSKTDEELLELAADLNQLTPEAQSALKNELVRRQLGLVEELQQQPNATVPIIEKPKPSQKQFSTSYRTSEFIAEVLRIYHARLRFFVMLMVPVVGVGYIAAIYGRRIAMQIAQHIFMEDISYSWISLAISSLVITRFFISWVLFFFAFGVICIAVFQMQSGDAPSLMPSLREVWKSKLPFMKLCILFFFLVLITYGMCSLFALGLLSVANKGHFHLSQRLIFVSAFCFSGLLLLVLSRFALAVPAVVLDQSTAWRAIFRSDELTQGKWSTLAALLAKSLVGGYVAAMLPYWVSPWVPASIATFSWYPWIQVLVATLAVAVVEPPMFIGFALLYLKMREEPSSAEAPKFTTVVSSA